MSFGGMMGFPEEKNPGSEIYKQNLADPRGSIYSGMEDVAKAKIQQRANRTMDFQRLRQPQTPPRAMQGMNPMQQPMSRPPAQAGAAAQGAMRPQPMPPQRPSIQPAISPVQEAPMQNVQVPGFSGAMERPPQEQPKTLDNSLNNRLTSEDPGVFSSSIEEIGSMKDEDINPDTPAGQMVQKADQQFGMGIDDNGEKMYKDPITKKPCGKKTFWTRLKNFFQSLTGLTSKEDAQKESLRLDKIDPISRKYTSSQVQAKTPEASSVWNRPGRGSGANGAMNFKGAN